MIQPNIAISIVLMLPQFCILLVLASLATPALFSEQYLSYDTPSEDTIIANYLQNFEILAQREEWQEILAEGSIALKAAQQSCQHAAAAKICAQLTSTYFYMGNYDQALLYAKYCHELADACADPSFLIRAFYLESAIYRALAGKEQRKVEQQALYAQAIKVCEEAAHLYSIKVVENTHLKGKVYFNLGAAHADNPIGDLDKAENFYVIAIDCFKKENAIDDLVRTMIRLGKVNLLLNHYTSCQEMIDAVRLLVSNQRLSMHVDYLEGQLKFALKDFEKAYSIVSSGLETSRILRAKEDEFRLSTLMQKIEDELQI